jgi:hypothetical protein
MPKVVTKVGKVPEELFSKNKSLLLTQEKAFVCNIALAPSNCCRRQLSNYRSRSGVSQLSSGWYQSGSTTQLAPGKSLKTLKTAQ